MENACYFNFKALCALEIGKFFSDFYCHVEKRLDKEAKVTSQTGKQIITNAYCPISQEVKAT